MGDVVDWDVTDSANNSAAPDGAPEGMAPSGLNNVLRAIMGAVARWYGDTNGTLTSGGSSNAYTLTSNRGLSAYTDGDVFLFEANHTNDGAATLNVDSVGATAIVKPNGSALVGGEIVSGGRYLVTYDGTSFQLVSDADRHLFAYKTASETVNNSTTLQNDNHLVLPVQANSKYVIRAHLFISPDSPQSSDALFGSADFAFNFSIPSGASGWAGGQGGTSATTIGQLGSGSIDLGVVATGQWYTVMGFIETAGTAGNLQLQWAQENGQSTNTNLRQGSWLELIKV